MQRSTDRILTTHTGSLPRPSDLVALLNDKEAGKHYDTTAFDQRIHRAIFEIVKRLNLEQPVSLLLAEQNTNRALKYATYGYILENGRVVMDGAAQELRENEDVKEFYLGIGGGDRKSFRNVKSYKRRKRWLA